MATIGFVSGLLIGAAIADTVNNSKEKQNKERVNDRIGKRVRFPTRKQAKDVATQAGKGKKPILHNTGKGGAHYHPDVPIIKAPRTPHQPSPYDHYYFTVIPNLLLKGIRNEKDKYSETIIFGK